MKLLTVLLGFGKKSEKITKALKAESNAQDPFIRTGREQFRKLQELGVKIPIAVL